MLFEFSNHLAVAMTASFNAMSARAICNVVDADFPRDGSVEQKLDYALKCAAMGAVREEWQPWQFRLQDGCIELSASFGGAEEEVDPDGRELTIRCGAALFHLKLALRRFGSLGRVELFPDLDQAWLVARVRCGFSQAHDGQTADLFEAMTRRREEFASPSGSPVSDATHESLKCSVAGEKAWVEFSQSESSRDRLVSLAGSEVRPSTANHRAGNQFTVLVTQSGAAQYAGSRSVSRNSRIAQWARPLLNFNVRNAESGTIAVEAVGTRPDQMAVLAMLKTKTDDKHGWLAAGQAMARVRLLAKVSDVSCRVFDQAFQSRHARRELRTAIGRKGFVQATIGFGSRIAPWTPTQPVLQTATASMR